MGKYFDRRAVPQRLNMELPCDPGIPRELNIHIHVEICIQMFITTWLDTIAPKVEVTRFLSRQVGKLWYIFTVEYYWAYENKWSTDTWYFMGELWKKKWKSQGRGTMAQLAIHPLQALGSYTGTDHIPDAAFPIQLSIYGLGKE